MIKLILSTDGKNSIWVEVDKVQSTEQLDEIYRHAKYLYDKVIVDLGTKAEMWDKAINGKTNGKSMSPVANFGKRVDTPEQVEQLFAPKCPVHTVSMKKRSGQYGEFWSCGTKLLNGSWCKETSSSEINSNNQKSLAI